MEELLALPLCWGRDGAPSAARVGFFSFVFLAAPGLYFRPLGLAMIGFGLWRAEFLSEKCHPLSVESQVFQVKVLVYVPVVSSLACDLNLWYISV